MKISENWLRQWVNPNLSTTELVEQMAMMGLTIDVVLPVAGVFSHVVIGKVIAAKPHPDAVKLTCCTVDVGQSESLSIVCGAPNVRAGLKVAVALMDAVLPNGVKIKKVKLRGENSEGMICSASELGLQFLQTASEGILELPEDAPIGEDFRTYFQADDHVLDVEITPNRGDCLSARGLARDIAAMNKISIQDVAIKAVCVAKPNTFSVEVKAIDDCPRYIGRVIKNIDNTRQTPFWIQRCLQRSGIRPINAVVDVCNYVMLELGQPMHGFDLSTLHGGLVIRKANPSEIIRLLDEREIILSSEDLVIADQQKPQALAGIMGGVESAVSSKTIDLFLESAFFIPKTVCLSARRHDIHSDSSYRFERGVDFQLPMNAMERATELLLSIVGGEALQIVEVVSEHRLPKREPIVLRRDDIARILGIYLSDHHVIDIFHALRMRVHETTHGFEITPPSDRFDMTSSIDLIEELARLFGYENIPASPITLPLSMQPYSEKEMSLSRIRSCLVDRSYHEAITYSFIDPKIHELFSPQLQLISLKNPLSMDMSVMRGSLWPGLLKAMQMNLHHHQSRVRLFETGLTFEKNDHESQLNQVSRLAIAATGDCYGEQWGMPKKNIDFYDVKSDVLALLALTHRTQDFHWKKCTHHALHPGRGAALYDQEMCVGWLGELHPVIMEAFDFKQSVIVAEFQLKHLQCANIPVFQMFSRFPGMRRDLALIVNDALNARELEIAIKKTVGSILQSVQIFDIYQGKGIENGKKSIALGLTFQDPSRTLRDEEINEIIHGVVSMLEKEFYATLRT